MSTQSEREWLEGLRFEDKFPEDEEPSKGPDRCGGCGQFLRKDSLYSNRCSDCWTPEDDFWF